MAVDDALQLPAVYRVLAVRYQVTEDGYPEVLPVVAMQLAAAMHAPVSRLRRSAREIFPARAVQELKFLVSKGHA